MNVHNAVRRAGSLLDGIRRMIGGDLDVNVERVGETLTPIMNPWGLPEWALLRREYLWSAYRGVAAVPVEFSGMAVVNPPGSGAILIVDGATFRGSAAQSGHISLQLLATITATYAANGQAIARDSRTAMSRPASTTLNVNPVVYTGSDVALFANSLELVNAGATVGTVDFRTPPYILRPGVGLVITGGTVNIGIDALMYGRWRSALPGELD